MQIRKREVGTANGHADNPLTRDELRGRYQECARLVMRETDVVRLSDMLARLGKLPDVDELMDVLHRFPVQ